MRRRTAARGRLRIALDAVLLSAVVLVILLLTLGSNRGEPGHAPTPRQVSATTRWLRELTLPAIATPNPSDTACQIPVALCVTSERDTRVLALAMRSAVRARGGTPGSVTCDRASGLCTFGAVYRDTRIMITAHQITGYLKSSSVALAAIHDGNRSLPPPQPLPPPGTITVPPRGVIASLGCVHHLHGGCDIYAGRLQGLGGARDAAQRWMSLLETSGWLAQRTRCGARANGDPCGVAATRSLTQNGGRFVLLQGTVSARGRKLTGVVRLFSIA